MRAWWVALGAAAFLAGQAWPGQDPHRHWLAKDGADWRRMTPEAQAAYTEGFLTGAAVGQAHGTAAAADSAALTAEVARLRRAGELRFPFGPNVYGSRINDYFWWENHRPLPIWYAFWEVNNTLVRPRTDSTP